MVFTVKKVLEAFAAVNDDETIKYELDQLDIYGVSLIHYFTVLDYHELIQLIVTHGANPNIKAKGSFYTPLIIAAARGYDHSVKVLIELGA